MMLYVVYVDVAMRTQQRLLWLEYVRPILPVLVAAKHVSRIRMVTATVKEGSRPGARTVPLPHMLYDNRPRVQLFSK